MSFCLPLILCLVFLFTASAPVAAERAVLAVVGDIMLAGSASSLLSREGFDYPFAATARILRGSDMAVGNLEAPLAFGGMEFSDKKYRFKVSPRAASALRDAGFTVLTLANNHIMDFGVQGLHETLASLKKERILYTGAGANLNEARKPAIVEKDGVIVAFLAYSFTFPVEFYAGKNRPGTAPGYLSFFREDIRKAASCADYVVVSFHWGEERSPFPKSYQIEAAHSAVDAGAHLVIGHHPHVLQGIECYKGALILYSLGNFVFGSMSREVDVSVIARVVLDGGVRTVELFPLNVSNVEVSYRPTLLKGRRGDEVVSRLRDLSRPWGTKIMVEGMRYFVKMEPEKTAVASRWRHDRESR